MLIDTTLREGAQLFGAYFNMEKRLTIVNGLMELGIEEIELGWIGQEGLEELVEQTRAKNPASRLSVWSPCREADVRATADLAVDRINIGVPASDEHLTQRLKTDRHGLLERVGWTVLAAKLSGIKYVSVGLEDVSRADVDFALIIAKLARDMGASRVRLSDSLGLWTPMAVHNLIPAFRKELDIDLAVHCHDDFGMATANALTALACGADYADGSVLGIGERSGIAATEEMAAHLTLMEENHAYQISSVRELCDFVSLSADVPIPRTKAVAGKDIFACESGIHAHALDKSPALFEPYDPDSIGAHRTVAVGGKSGRGAVSSALEANRLHCPEKGLNALVSAVRKMAWDLERPLTRQELSRLVNQQ